MTTVVTFGNFKGGTGKTTNSTMMAYELAEKGYKMLLVDLDPQANATDLYLKTRAICNEENTEEEFNYEATLMTAINNGDLRPIITNIKENLDLLPSYEDFSLYPDFLENRFSEKPDRVKYFSTLLDEIKDDYDFIFIDVPPTISIVTDSALYASDGIVIVLQTQERSLKGCKVFMGYLQSIVTNYDTELGIVGILPVLLKNNSLIDKAVVEKARLMFGDDTVFNNIVKNRERLKRFDIDGITNKKTDIHDRNVHRDYINICEEFLTKIAE